MPEGVASLFTVWGSAAEGMTSPPRSQPIRGCPRPGNSESQSPVGGRSSRVRLSLSTLLLAAPQMEAPKKRTPPKHTLRWGVIMHPQPPSFVPSGPHSVNSERVPLCTHRVHLPEALEAPTRLRAPPGSPALLQRLRAPQEGLPGHCGMLQKRLSGAPASPST